MHINISLMKHALKCLEKKMQKSRRFLREAKLISFERNLPSANEQCERLQRRQMCWPCPTSWHVAIEPCQHASAHWHTPSHHWLARLQFEPAGVSPNTNSTYATSMQTHNFRLSYQPKKGIVPIQKITFPLHKFYTAELYYTGSEVHVHQQISSWCLYMCPRAESSQSPHQTQCSTSLKYMHREFPVSLFPIHSSCQSIFQPPKPTATNKLPWFMAQTTS